MERTMYPAIFHKDENGYWVEFPDLAGCLTEGKTFDEAFYMASDALFCWLEFAKNKPIPSSIEQIKPKKDEFVQMIEPIPFLSEDAKQYMISEAIEHGLKERNLNNNQVASILDVDRSYITYIAKGKRVPSVEMAQRIGLLLNFDWHIFFNNENKELEPTT